ncbi:MAG: molecular chaperone HtpG [Caldilineaceae bacterium]|nr:molecular chaperone HtpG [Caldilineaceae bacterium]
MSETDKTIQKDAEPVAESMEYRTEVKQLLDILAHSLYTDREIFLRELISNASDALNRIQFEMLTDADVLDADVPLAIHLLVDEDAKRLTISDTGIGMTRDDLIQNLGTIAHSGAKTFMRNADGAAGEGNGQMTLDEIIGQFGVGFYSAFMVAAEITVTSRSYHPDGQAWTWTSTGDSNFSLAPADKQTRGTDIEIQFKPDAAEFANKWKLESIIKKHSDYVSFPIFVEKVEPPTEGEDAASADAESAEAEDAGAAEADAKQPEPVNRQTALWRQQPSQVKDEEYKEFYRQLTFDFEEPLLYNHLVTDAPVDIRAILYIPSKRERGMFRMNDKDGLKLYSRKILIQESNTDLLPEYFRFVEGVVDSEDLPLNVSREMVQSNPILRQIRRALTSRLQRELKSLADKEPQKYASFWDEFGLFLKEGVATQADSRDALLELLRFHSTKSAAADSASAWEEVEPETAADGAESENAQTDTESDAAEKAPQSAGGLISLAQYVARMKADQSDIYYVLGDALSSVALSPHLDYFRAHDLEVLYMTDPIDGYMISMLREFDGKPFKNVDDSDLDLPENDEQKDEAEEASEGDFARLIARAKNVLGDRVTDVRESKQLVKNPCRLVSPQGSPDRDLQRLLRLTQQDYEIPKKMLELNRKHPVIVHLTQILAKNAADPLLDTAIEQLFGNALLLEGAHPNPTEMVQHIQALMESALAARAG